MGRYPKAQALRVVEDGLGKGGRSRAHRPVKTEPKYLPLTEHPPDFLDREAKAEWRRLMTEFNRYPGLVQRPDREGMIALCSEWSVYLSAIKDRLTATGRAQDRARVTARDSLKQLFVMWSRFGLTPGDRARFDLAKKEGGHDPILGLLTGGGEPSD